jgi:tetratricopeptide (TPR) repeat protein
MVKGYKHLWLIPSAFALIVFASLWFFYNSRMNRVESKRPSVNLENVEPQVAAKIRRLQGEVEKHPESPANWGRLGMTLHVHGFKIEAVEAYRKAAGLDPKDFRWPYYSATILNEVGSAEALVCFETALRLRPDYVPLQVRYGRALFQAGKMNEGEERFNAAIAIDPRCVDAYVGLAQVELARNNPEEAKQSAQKAIELNPKQSDAYALLADAYRGLHDLDAASRVEKQSQTLGQRPEMSDPVYAALASEGESAYWHRTRGRAYVNSGLHEMALLEFQTALKLHPDADAYDNVGVALQNLGRLSEAVDYHKKATAMNGGYLAYYNLGIAYGKLGQYSEAIEALQNSLRLKQDNAEAYFNRGVAYFKLSQWRQSEEDLKQAIHYNPNHSAAHYALAMTYLQEKQPKAAFREYEILKKLDPQLARRFEQRQ